MLIVMKPDAMRQDVSRVVEIVEKLGYKAHVLPGAVATVVGITGNPGALDLAYFDDFLWVRLSGINDIINNIIFSKTRYFIGGFIGCFYRF